MRNLFFILVGISLALNIIIGLKYYELIHSPSAMVVCDTPCDVYSLNVDMMEKD